MKIQLKRSNVLDGGEAKKPTADQMEYGELAVNYNDADPALFIKDSNDAIIRIAGSGAGANGNIEIPDSGGGPNQPGTLDDRYLKLAADAGDQTVASTGKTIFSSEVGIGTDTPQKLLDVDGDALINNMNVGRGPGNSLTNAVFGSNALRENTTGTQNTAVGSQALKSNTTGEYNTAFGRQALNFNIEGNENTALGGLALYSNITGSFNTAVGVNAGFYIEGSNNTILGAYEGTGADRPLNDTVIIAAGPTERIRIDENGNAGIGGSLPASPNILLNADGSATFDGLVEAGSGVKVAGGTSAGVENGYLFSSGFLREVVGSKSVTFNNGTSYSMSLDGSGGVNNNIVFTKDYAVVNITSDTNDTALLVKGNYNNSATPDHSSLWSQGIDYTGIADDALIFGLRLNSPTNTAATTAAKNYGVYVSNDHTDAFSENYGIFSIITQGSNTNYNFYAAGDAPNYFEGDITCNGLINGAFRLRMETDDPAAFTTTLTTNEDGNEVSKTVYQGTTEDLLSIIKDLRARVAALEAASQ